MPDSKLYTVKNGRLSQINQNRDFIMGHPYTGSKNILGIYKGSTHVWAPNRIEVIYKEVNSSSFADLTDTFYIPNWCQSAFYVLIGGGGEGSYGDGWGGKGGRAGEWGGYDYGISKPLKVGIPFNHSDLEVTVTLGKGGKFSNNKYHDGSPSTVKGAFNNLVKGGKSRQGEYTNGSAIGQWKDSKKLALGDNDWLPLNFPPGTQISLGDFFSSPYPGRGGNGGRGGAFGSNTSGKPGTGGGIIVWGLSGIQSPRG